ncbi:hypothetical protein Rsub_03858 [Raphidocelis subcapitata]|uniref:Phosphatidylglycerol lysyltransferase C-terminal domain-containing protein n=1 Tax=Raphidocelis subcapitata TaxID=307507 RepID=A0A2V0NZI7_9CHLO|nr:hypothetical protein Rsub_03858 [Raphidocelis subcapitata]|eukprot:GBF91003.1 hypothetical protein Rsub_03858 [Raphidocelis subcapitata]
MNAKGASPLPAALDLVLRILVGVLINIVLKILCVYAGCQVLLRKLLGLQDPGAPRPVAVAVPWDAAPRAPQSEAGARCAGGSDDGQLSSDEDVIADITADDGGAEAGAKLLLPKGAASAAGPGPTRLVQAAHIPVDAVAGADSDAWRLVGPYLRQYGSGALSSSTLWNPEFLHFFVPGLGSQPYVIGRAYNRTIVVGVGDPLAAREHWLALASGFRRAFPIATFAHVGADFGRLLRDELGYGVNDMGAETNIRVQAYAYGKKTRTIKNAVRDAKAGGVAVRELTAAELTPEVCDQLAHVTGDWVKQKAVGDSMLRVFIRHLDYENLHLAEGVRLFVAERTVPDADAQPGRTADDAAAGGGAAKAAGRKVVEGFVLVDPLWRGGEVYGYVTSLNRMRQGSHHGTLKLLYDEVMSAAKREGKEVLTFGFSPFFNLQLTPFMGALWVEAAGRFLFEFGNTLYQFKNLAFSKARYGGSVEGDAYKDPNVTMTHVYGATNTRLLDIGMLDLYVLLMYVGFFGNLDDTLFKMAGLRKSMGNSFSEEPAGAIKGAAAGGGGDE